MKEYIERAAAMEAILGLTIVDPAVAQYANAVCYHLQNLPAADVVEVVRCRECTHYKICDEWKNGKRMLCEIHHHSYLDHDGDNHFCSWGQRKIETVLPKSDAKDERLEGEHD